jgi:hypothetical protein
MCVNAQGALLHAARDSTVSVLAGAGVVPVQRASRPL